MKGVAVMRRFVLLFGQRLYAVGVTALAGRHTAIPLHFAGGLDLDSDCSCLPLTRSSSLAAL